ncbi:MAG: FG-GAP repeat domain-containing protein [Planctomycetota bacterium]
MRFILSGPLSGRLTCAILALIASSSLPCRADDQDEPNELAQYYGFSGIEVFKMHERAFNLQGGDFTGDGLNDILLVDNFDSCIRLMAQRNVEDQKKARVGKVNDLESDWRFEERTLPVDKAIAGMCSGDFNGDKRLDFAVIGTPDQLAIRYQPEPGQKEWTRKWTTRLPAIEPVAWMIAAGDLNSDRRDDIVVLGKEVTYILYQNDQGEMETPQALMNTSAQLSMVQVADLNGDSRHDLCYLASDGSNRGLCARLQTKDGRLGPEICFSLEQPRSVTLSNIDQKPGHEIVTIQSRNGHVLVSSLKPVAEPTTVPNRLLRYGIGPVGASRERAVAAADFDGDQLMDLVVADPEQAQILMYRQNGIDGLGTAQVFPSLLGVTDLATADSDGDGRTELYLLSPKEGTVAVSQFENGRLTFPRNVILKPENAELLALTSLTRDGKTQLVLSVTMGTGNAMKLSFQRYACNEQGAWEPVVQPEKLEFTNAVGPRGARLVQMDVNADGRQDILSISSGTAKTGLVVLTQADDGSLVAGQKIAQDPGISSAGRTFVAGDQFLIARDSFARAMKLDGSSWKVVDQFNAGETSANIEGVASLDLDGEPGDEIILVDTGVKKLRILRRQEGVYRPWKEVDLGNMPFTSTLVRDFNGDGRSDLVLLGGQQFSVLYSGGTESDLQELASFEPDRDDAYPADVIAGDINGDGQMDLTMIDTSIDGIAVLNFDEKKGIREATHFRIFEEKRLVSSENDRGTEPREGLVLDVTADGRSDLVLLCHDRALFYTRK